MNIFDPLKNEKGFLLPLAVILVMVLGISGAAFYQLDFQERRMDMKERWNQEAFYLANAGIERVRETLKIGTISGSPSWTPVLDKPDTDPNYPADSSLASLNVLLCPDIVTHPYGSAEFRGCVIPPFQTTARNSKHIITSNDNGSPIKAVVSPVDGSLDMPFSRMCTDTADDGCFYSVRAFNNVDDPSISDSAILDTTDQDGKITLRALGSVHGIQKMIQTDVIATTDLGLINCVTGPCPQRNNGRPLSPDEEEKTLDYIEGRDPQVIAAFSPNPITSFYNDYQKFGFSSQDPVPNNTLTPVPGHYYFRTGDVTVNAPLTGAGMIVIYATGKVTVANNVTLNNSIVIGENAVEINSNAIVHAPLPYPAILAGNGGVSGQGNQSTVYGSVFSTGSVDVNPLTIFGVVIGNTVTIQGFGAMAVDDQDNPAYYGVMPGFNYPDDMKNTVISSQSWREIK